MAGHTKEIVYLIDGMVKDYTDKVGLLLRRKQLQLASSGEISYGIDPKISALQEQIQCLEEAKTLIIRSQEITDKLHTKLILGQ